MSNVFKAWRTESVTVLQFTETTTIAELDRFVPVWQVDLDDEFTSGDFFLVNEELETEVPFRFGDYLVKVHGELIVLPEQVFEALYARLD